MTEGIKQLTKKNMHDVSNAINSIDTEKVIDKKICGTGDWNGSNAEAEGKCNSGKGTPSSLSPAALSSMFDGGGSNASNRKYPADAAEKMGTYPQTSAKISKDMSELTRGEKGVVSSAFAKAHEGAKIVVIT